MACCFITFLFSLLFQLTLCICFIIHVAVADPDFANFLCPDMESIAPNSKFQSNVNTLLALLNSNTTNNSHFCNATVGNGANKVYRIFICLVDHNIAFCQKCFSLAVNSLNSHCPGKKILFIWYDQCIIRYFNDSFFGKNE